MLSKSEKIFRKLRIIQASLSVLVLALAAALKVVVILCTGRRSWEKTLLGTFLSPCKDLQEKNDQVERAKVLNEALKQQNRILVQRVSEAEIVHGGNLYYFSCDKISWDDANQYCVSRGSNLTSITSVEEQEFIYEKGADVTFWIGLNNKEGSKWTWIDGKPFDEVQSKRFWAPGKPNNREHNCVTFWTISTKSWRDENCLGHFKFICKRNCESSRLCNGIQNEGSTDFYS
ncbi:C-type lectin domain family 4 member K-like [Dromiciops gliroides]|uniref:C-type lectin domain family 4 member K-like n=1 Tax=Dromiciops gliroides TaxID=33562 RepID=UPI001CC47DDB|nr:C-type lectin domain family 4 member K-like [Dromiciops gliroides]